MGCIICGLLFLIFFFFLLIMTFINYDDYKAEYENDPNNTEEVASKGAIVIVTILTLIEIVLAGAEFSAVWMLWNAMKVNDFPNMFKYLYI